MPKRIAKHSGKILIVLAMIGIIIASYLLYVELNAAAGACGKGCTAVNTSKYAKIYGVPIALIGVIGYSIVFVTVILKVTLLKKHKLQIRKFLWTIIFLAFLFSSYLTYLEVFIIQAICPYCIASAIVVLLMLVAISITLKYGKL
ncbi:vitamin K epoxide reductase [Candidatus Woesearchaeota archaeon]|nr:MAG: vitamin K epoxide reductase [Candidatus Woesearchaeota archaeon]